MTTLVMPEGTPTLGNTKIVACVSLANPLAPDLSGEIGAGTSVELSCFVYPAGWNPSGTQGKGTKPPRLCTKSQRDALQRVSWTAPSLQYVYDPTAADNAAGNEAKELLVEGAVVYVVERRGVDADTAFAASDRVRVHHLRVGAQIPSGDLTDENGEFFIMQETEYVSDPVDGVVAA
jgi:hypothetical protein